LRLSLAQLLAAGKHAGYDRLPDPLNAIRDSWSNNASPIVGEEATGWRHKIEGFGDTK
jgi:hypothetical protein